MQVRLIANPNASGVEGALIDQVAARLARVGDVEVRLTERPGHATELARPPGADVVVAMGGDDTANEVANGMPPGALMGVVPAGASSVFARQLRLPRRTLSAADVLAGAIAERRWRPVGLGSVNGRMFTFSAGMGLEAEATRIVDERRRLRPDGRRPRDSAVVLAAGRVLWTDRLSMPARITVTAGDRTVRASYLAIANQHPYSYWGRLPVRTTPRASFASALDAVVVSELRPRQLWRLPAYGLLWPRHARGRDRLVSYLHDVAVLDVACDVPVGLQLDGEYLGQVETAAVRYHPQALRMLIPPAAEASFPVPAPEPAAAGT
jgi:diacylglycerol kinase family enzyme